MTIGQRIKVARTESGLSQRELGERLGVSQAMIGQYEGGMRNPKYETIKRIADALGVTSDYLRGYTDDPYTRLARQVDMDHFGEKEPPEGWITEEERNLVEKFRDLSAEEQRRIKFLIDYDLDRLIEKNNAPDNDPGQ